MPFRRWFAVFAVAAGLTLPGFPNSTAYADVLDAWCAQAKLPSSIAVCGDPELRALTIERQHAFDGARARVGEAQAPALLADQNAWVKSYPVACGLAPDVAPSLPLAPGIRDCMALAGRARITYLQAYGTAATPAAIAGTVPASGQIGPGFDCAVAVAPLARLICSDPQLSKTDLRFNQAYEALRQTLDTNGRRQLALEDVQFLNTVKVSCGVPDAGVIAGSAECVAAQYNGKRSEWLSRLSGPAYEEASRPIEQHVALQAQLQQLGYLAATAKIDGVYSSATRSATSEWQTASGRPVTGVLSNSDATALGGGAPGLVAKLTPSSGPTPSNKPQGQFDAGAGAPVGAEVALRSAGGVYRVPVRINRAITLDFLVDSGASDVLIPADVVLTLFRTETLVPDDFAGTHEMVLADGSKLPSASFVLRELMVGDHRLANVTASVGPVESVPLLGQSFLSRFKSWTLDNDRHALVLIER
jgi:uncharacterized protein/predicted aspartyl protease